MSTDTEDNQINSIVKKPSKVDTLLNHLEISVAESEKRVNGSLNLRDFYTVYLIEVKATDPEFQTKLGKLTSVWRRYTEFEQLRDYLEVTYPYIVLPPLPEKRVLYGWQKISNDTFDPNFIDRRRAGLENFLLRIAAHPLLTWDEHFLEFLQQEEGWRESYKSNGYIQLVENKLKSISVSVRLKQPEPKFEAFKDYGGNLYMNLNNLLKARSRVAEKQYIIHKLHANYGRVFSEWSVIEKDMGDALQKTGHYLDSLASSIDANLEDEELLADQLKEYLFFAGSLQTVCRHHEQLQLRLEDAEDTVAGRNVERTRVQQGKTGLMSKLFGAVDSDEVREYKVNLLDQQIQEGAKTVSDTKEILSDFTEKALKDIDRFQIQKAQDLRDTLANYAFIQLKTAKKKNWNDRGIYGKTVCKPKTKHHRNYIFIVSSSYLGVWQIKTGKLRKIMFSTQSTLTKIIILTLPTLTNEFFSGIDIILRVLPSNSVGKNETLSDANSLKLGFGIWITLCMMVCFWFLGKFAKGRRQFQANLHVIEDGLRRMQEDIETKSQKSIGYVDDADDISDFMRKFNEAGDQCEQQEEGEMQKKLTGEIKEEEEKAGLLNEDDKKHV
ncbi:unnamed protein product [Phaedon cochleariae]|uniref:PX domain-containing protein n=1 Tax=Phaedon cochleariae TaxID=80249 RepID=A0A9N9SM84_PHACE|nr:unnamed protein product [Phaedon cochleariae]